MAHIYATNSAYQPGSVIFVTYTISLNTMPKKQTAPAQTIIRIGTGATEKTVLSKAQKEFNRLTKKIETLERETANIRETGRKLQTRVQTELRPLVQKHEMLLIEMIKLLDRMHPTKGLTKPQRNKIAHIIRDTAFGLIDNGHDDLKAIYEKYDEQGFEVANEEAEQATAEQMKQMMSMMFGIDFDDDADVSTPEKLNAYLHQKMHERNQEQEQQQQQRAAKRAQKPKTAKQQALDEKRETEARNITKAVRTLYMDLVKTFHPDREPDETEKARKTEVMQRVTAAYETSDLLALLKLQLEFNRIDQNHLENLADEQLKHYNKILREQVEELETEQFQEEQRVGSMMGGSMLVMSSYGIEFRLNQSIAQVKEQTKQLKSDLIMLSNVDMLKAWLRSYRIER